mgnify:CR=1 FL=1
MFQEIEFFQANEKQFKESGAPYKMGKFKGAPTNYEIKMFIY